jgi:hypothetical protein
MMNFIDVKLFLLFRNMTCHNLIILIKILFENQYLSNKYYLRVEVSFLLLISQFYINNLMQKINNITLSKEL